MAHVAVLPRKHSDLLETAVRQQPENVDALYSLTFVYSALKRREPALRMLAPAARLAPKPPATRSLWYHLRNSISCTRSSVLSALPFRAA